MDMCLSAVILLDSSAVNIDIAPELKIGLFEICRK